MNLPPRPAGMSTLVAFQQLVTDRILERWSREAANALPLEELVAFVERYGESGRSDREAIVIFHARWLTARGARAAR